MTTRKSGMGRPVVSPEGARDAVMTVRLLPVERRAVHEAAKLAGMSASDWIRLTLLAAAQAEKHRAAGAVRTADAAAAEPPPG